MNNEILNERAVSFSNRFRQEIFADKRKSVIFAFPINGALAERLGTGLQNLLQRFDSARHLQKKPPTNYCQGLF